jgi:hypothetical protein
VGYRSQNARATRALLERAGASALEAAKALKLKSTDWRLTVIALEPTGERWAALDDSGLSQKIVKLN